MSRTIQKMRKHLSRTMLLGFFVTGLCIALGIHDILIGKIYMGTFLIYINLFVLNLHVYNLVDHRRWCKKLDNLQKEIDILDQEIIEKVKETLKLKGIIESKLE